MSVTPGPWEARPYEALIGPSVPMEYKGRNEDGSFRMSVTLTLKGNPVAGEDGYHNETHWRLCAGRKTLADCYTFGAEAGRLALTPELWWAIFPFASADPMDSAEDGEGACHWCGAWRDQIPGDVDSFVPHDGKCLWRQARWAIERGSPPTRQRDWWGSGYNEWHAYAVLWDRVEWKDGEEKRSRGRTTWTVSDHHRALAQGIRRKADAYAMAAVDELERVVLDLSQADPMDEWETCVFCGASADRLPGTAHSFTPHDATCPWREARRLYPNGGSA